MWHRSCTLRLESLLGDREAVAEIDRAQRLKAPAGAGHDDEGGRFFAGVFRGGFGCVHEKAKELGRHKRHVDGQQQVQLGGRMQERRVNAGEGAATREDIGDDWPVAGEGFGIADDGDVAAGCAQCGERTVKEGLAAKIQESFIGAHAGAFASGEEEGSMGTGLMAHGCGARCVRDRSAFRLAAICTQEYGSRCASRKDASRRNVHRAT